MKFFKKMTVYLKYDFSDNLVIIQRKYDTSSRQ